MTTGWRKSTYSGDNASCIKIRFDGPDVLLGDTKATHLAPDEPILRLPAAHWPQALTALYTFVKPSPA
jgi:hypothetical protein